ncbi:MAG: hypothetical protein FD133_832 [Erysipelotrichaceae bacterium]|nr:MAG: hypothetical protein FD179_957 [Erysipelotrichaceae bacterium]TXT18470.1 MAG: hypothetical protein FD133_832 [Erysipelotrichaceae bacterium]
MIFDRLKVGHIHLMFQLRVNSKTVRSSINRKHLGSEQHEK